MNDINNNNNFINNINYPLNDCYLRNIIKDEFTNLIVPYQKDAMCNSNLMETKLNEVEKNYKLL